MARLLLSSLLLVAVSCTQGAAPPPAPARESVRERSPGTGETDAVGAGWMGRFARRDPALAELLKANPGWAFLRDMSLFEAIQAFAGGDAPAERIGAARAYLALADLSASLDQLLLEVEGAYLAARPQPLSPAQRARRLVVALRSGDTATADAALDAGAAAGFAYTWQLAAARRGRTAAAPATAPGSEGERVLGQVAAYLWGGPAPAPGDTPYDQGVAAFRAGDLAGGVLTLQLLEFSPDASGPGAELLLYALLERAFAGLARDALAGLDGAGAHFLLAQARHHLGDLAGAAAAYRGVGTAAAEVGRVADATLLYSPYTGAGDLAAVAAARASGAPSGGGSLAALVAAPDAVAVTRTLAVLSTPPALAADADPGRAVPELYAARRAEGARLAARRLWLLGEGQLAVDALERAHRKSSGYRPDFVNPPGFLVDLARGHQKVGEYAPAVAALFELSAEYPSARVAYESLKRLYASHTGGEVPPR